MRTLQFRDEPSFYSELRKLTEQGEHVRVKTNFRSPDEVPENLRRLLNLQPLDLAKLTLPTGEFSKLASLGTTLNTSVLCVLGSAAAGAVFGLLFGPLGVVIGAGIGLVVGISAAAFASDKRVEVRGGLDGNLEFIISTAK